MTCFFFFQDLYINEPFVCGGAEKDCVRQYPGCVPCDWSDPKTNPAPGEVLPLSSLHFDSFLFPPKNIS